ncbi:MAG: ArsR/SmtB family transcription factor [Thermodesulfobacteriota bacterium]
MEIQENKDICQALWVHTERVAQVKKAMHADGLLLELAEVFKVLGDHTRVRILHALSLAELCVCDISLLLAVSPSAVSHQLRILRAAKIVRFRKEGKNVYYSLDDEHVFNLISEGMAHVREG